MYDSFIGNLGILLESNKKINRLMNVGYAENYQANLGWLLKLLGHNRRMFSNSNKMLSESFLKLFEFHNKDSQKFLNVGIRASLSPASY